jgi:hypothetical protein
MSIGTLIRGLPTVEYLYILIGLLALTAFYKGVRSWEESKEEVPWFTLALSAGGIPWVLVCTISLVQIFMILADVGAIPFLASNQLQGLWLALFYVVLGLAMLLFACFSRLLLVWLGFEWRRRQG